MSASCFECDAPADHHHHVVPRSLGGRRTVPLCGACHARAHGLDDRTWAGHAGLVRAAIAVKKARGERVGSVPYGYRLAADGVALEVEPAEAAALTMAQERRAAGLSLRKIGAELSACGMRPRGGGAWHPDTVARLIAAAEGLPPGPPRGRLSQAPRSGDRRPLPAS